MILCNLRDLAIVVNLSSTLDISDDINPGMPKNSALPVKSTKQNFEPNIELFQMMEIFRQMTNDCIRIGLENNCSTLKKLSMLAYHKLENYSIMSYYKLTAISQACGRLSQMKKDIKKGRKPKSPYVQEPYLVFLLWIQNQWNAFVISCAE